MKVSINKANKIRNQLEALKIDVAVTVQVMNTDTDDDVVGATQSGELAFKQTLNTLSKKNNMVFRLRSIINDANNAIGITPVIAAIAEAEAQIKSHTTLLENIQQSLRYNKPILVEDFLADKAYQTELAVLDPAKKARPQRVELSVFDKALQDEWKSSVAELKLQSQKLQEQRNAMNHSNFVELPEEMALFLQEHKIV